MNEVKDTNQKKIFLKRKGEELNIVNSGKGLGEIKKLKIKI